MATSSEGPNQLFVGSIPVTLLQPSRSGPEYLSSMVDVVLKLVERRYDSTEKEYRLEISRPDEFEFLYAESITRSKYQILAKSWNLNADFDDFLVKIVRLLRERKSANSPVQVTCTLNQDSSLCTLEVVHTIDMYTVRMPIELKAVRGKDLLCHVTYNMRALQAEVNQLKMEKKKSVEECEELKQNCKALQERCDRAESEKTELEQRAKDIEKRLADVTLKKEEFEQDLEVGTLERDEHQSALNTIEDLNKSLEESERRYRQLEEDYSQCEEECEELSGKLRDSDATKARLRIDKENLLASLDKTRKDLTKANYVISKYLKAGMFNPDRSLDEKRNEMAADLKMKESLIDEMTASIAEYQKKAEELMKENTELRETLQTMEAERTRNARLIEMYRNQQRAVASRYVGVSPPVNPGIANTSPFFGGRTSPLGAFVPSTPTNFRNVLGRTLQSSTALVTPSMRATPPVINRNLPTNKENAAPPLFALQPTQPQAKQS